MGVPGEVYVEGRHGCVVRVCAKDGEVAIVFGQ